MKRSLISKLALAWCWFYSFMLLGSVALALRRSTDWTVFATLIPFAAMLYGSIGFYAEAMGTLDLCRHTGFAYVVVTVWLHAYRLFTRQRPEQTIGHFFSMDVPQLDSSCLPCKTWLSSLAHEE